MPDIAQASEMESPSRVTASILSCMLLNSVIVHDSLREQSENVAARPTLKRSGLISSPTKLHHAESSSVPDG
jgi:hypothetical protein